MSFALAIGHGFEPVGELFELDDGALVELVRAVDTHRRALELREQCVDRDKRIVALERVG